MRKLTQAMKGEKAGRARQMCNFLCFPFLETRGLAASFFC